MDYSKQYTSMHISHLFSKVGERCRPLRVDTGSTLLVLWLCLWALPAAAIGPDSVLINSGDIARVRAGTYGELFPNGGDAVDPTHKVLSLDFEYPEGVERHLVPFTESWRPERHPMVSYDSRSDAIMLFWVSGAADGTWSMELTSFRDGEWQQSSNVKSNQSAVFIEELPKVTVTSDDFYLDLGEEIEPLETRRTTFHVVWYQGKDVHYAPLSFVDGTFVGWSEAISLTKVAYVGQQGQSGDQLPPGFLPENLTGSFNIAPALDPNAITVSLTDSDTGRLSTLKIEETPMSLAHLAGRVREDILAHVGTYSMSDLEALADFIRSDIIFIGAKCRLHPTVGRFIADEISGWLLAYGESYGTDLTALSEDAWQETLNAGASIYAKSLGTATVDDDQALEIVDTDASAENLAKLRELVRITMPAAFEAPEIGEGESTIYTSADLRSMLIAWKAPEGDTIHYVENLGLGWTSEPLALRLTEELSEAQAHDLLQRKIR